MSESSEKGGGPEQKPHDKVPPCPRCGFHGANKDYCEVCGYLLMPMSPDISPRLRTSAARMGFAPRESPVDLTERWWRRKEWYRRVDYLDPDYEVPKATWKGVLLFLILLGVAFAVIWYRMSG